MERRSEMKRRYVESNDLSALDKVDALEKSMEAFRKEMNSKLEFIQEILRAKNAQIEAQKRILDYESTVFKTLIDNWDWESSSGLNQFDISHLVHGLDRDVSGVLYGEGGGEDDNDNLDLTYEPRNVTKMKTSRAGAGSRRSRKRKSPVSPARNSSTKMATMSVEESNPLSHSNNPRKIKDEDVEIIIEEFQDDMESSELETNDATVGKPYKKNSAVWDYFEMDPNNMDVHCTVCRETEDGNNYSYRRNKSGSTTAMRRHLQSAHQLDLYSNTNSKPRPRKSETDTSFSSPTTPKRQKSKKRSLVWDYFVKKDENQAECLVCKNEKICRIFTIHRGSTSGLLNHLHRVHHILSTMTNPESENSGVGMDIEEIDSGSRVQQSDGAGDNDLDDSENEIVDEEEDDDSQ